MRTMLLEPTNSFAITYRSEVQPVEEQLKFRSLSALRSALPTCWQSGLMPG